MLLDDVARRLIAQSGRDVEIVYTGLRPGEKLHEDLFGEAEHVVRRVHPLISHVLVPPLRPGAVTALNLQLPPAELTAELRDLCRASMPRGAAVPAGTGAPADRHGSGHGPGTGSRPGGAPAAGGRNPPALPPPAGPLPPGRGRWRQRLTPAGRPQLGTAPGGDMALGAPGPLRVTYVRRYTPAEHRRHALRPGLTGWAQVNGRNDLGWEARFAHDVWYVEHWSLRLDPRIAARPPVALARRQGLRADAQRTMD